MAGLLPLYGFGLEYQGRAFVVLRDSEDGTLWRSDPSDAHERYRLCEKESDGVYPFVVPASYVTLKRTRADTGQEKPAAVPVGATILWPTSMPPVGFLMCDGAAVDRDSFGELYRVIYSTYGDGNRETTFNLPSAANLPRVDPPMCWVIKAAP